MEFANDKVLVSLHADNKDPPFLPLENEQIL